MVFRVPESRRVLKGWHASTIGDGNNGAFYFPAVARLRGELFCIASDGGGWEHVSVSNRGRCPTWDEMCFVKQQFWSPDDCVLQYHPAEANYVNTHPNCLHLWRPVGVKIQVPPMEFV